MNIIRISTTTARQRSLPSAATIVLLALLSYAATNAGAIAAGNTTPAKIATGQPGKPITPDIQNILPGKPSANTPPVVPAPMQDATPFRIEESPGKSTEPLNHDNPINTGTIEYNALPPGEKPLTLSRAMGEAIRLGPRAAAIRAQLGITQAGLATASQSNNPAVFMDRGMMAEQVMRLGPVFNTDMPWEVYLRLLAAQRLVAQTKVDLLTQIWALREDVRRAYVELVTAQETQRTLNQLYVLSHRLYDVSQKRFNAGAVPELDVLKGHLLASQASVDVAVGLKRILRAKQQLNILMGRPVDAPLYVAPLPDYTGGLPLAQLRTQKSDILPDFNHDVSPLKLFVEMGIQSRLELKSLGLQLKVNTANKMVNYANIIPDPSFAMGKDTAGNEPIGPKITSVYMTLNQETPFTNFQQGGIYQYRATGYQLGFQVLSQRNQVYTDVASAYQNLLAARDKIAVYQERLLRDSNQVTRLANRSYEVGQSDITAALQAQQANIQVRSSYLNAINSYASAFADLEQAVGRPLQ